jgi:hypothetical protein
VQAAPTARPKVPKRRRGADSIAVGCAGRERAHGFALCPIASDGWQSSSGEARALIRQALADNGVGEQIEDLVAEILDGEPGASSADAA